MNENEALEHYNLPLSEVTVMADRLRRETVGDDIRLCTISNAKSESCSEDCKFCAQSAGYDTGIPECPLKSTDELLTDARRACEMGSSHFGIVTSGKKLSDKELGHIADVISAITSEMNIEICASLGCLSRDQLVLLRESGLSRYNHNIETSKRYFPEVVTSHRFEERLETLRNVAEAGLSICCGGIISMGETREDRVSMAFTLKELNVDSIPINVLIPIPGTPLEGVNPLSASEILKTIAIFRLIMPDKTIKLAAGRERGLRDFQGMAFMAGANGMIIGGYLTQKGRAADYDRDLTEDIREAWSR